jgi:adenylate kinase family enzyme
MIIVLEGPDGAGKTTLAREIQRQCGATYIHMTYRHKNKMPVYHTAALLHALSKVEKTGTPCILDRWWLTEMIYAKVYRGGPKWPEYGRMLDRMLIRFGGVYVLCVPGNEVAYRVQFKSLVESGRELYHDVDKMCEVRDEYQRLIYGTSSLDEYHGYHRHFIRAGIAKRFDMFIYDYQTMGHDMPSFAKQVCDYVHFSHTLQGNPEPSVSTAGNFQAATLLLGDTPNLKWGTHRPAWPFFRNAACSLHLCHVLDELGIDEHRLYFINMNHRLGKIELRKWLNWHAGRNGEKVKIGVFGEKAEVTLLENFDLVYTPLPHPQAANRFPTYKKLFIEKLRRFLNA